MLVLAWRIVEVKAGSSLGWVASWRSVEARGRWGLGAAASGPRPRLAEGLLLRFDGRRPVLEGVKIGPGRE